MKEREIDPRRTQPRTPSQKPMRRLISDARPTEGVAEGDLDTVEQDLKIQDRRHAHATRH